MSISTKDKVFKLFESFTEDYRHKRTRLDARVIFRMEVNNLAPNLSDENIVKLNEYQQEFVKEYLSLSNILKKRSVRIEFLKKIDSDLSSTQFPSQKSMGVAEKSTEPNETIPQLITKKKEVSPDQSNAIGQ